MSSSLGLAGDLDDIELIQDVEAAFGILLSDAEVESCWTVGHLFELVKARIPDASTGSCATAMAFYRLRSAVRTSIDAELRPTTPISDLGSLPVRRLHRIIREDCGLRPPPEQLSYWGCIALALVAALPLGVWALNFGWWAAAASAIPPLALYRVAPIRLPSRVETFGDLVRIVASRSIGALSQQGARLGSSEAWAAFKDVLSDHTSLPAHAISLDTLIMAPKKRAS